jgi:hypothetical protein
VGDRRLSPDELLDERLERCLDLGAGRLLSRRLARQVDVSAPAGDQPTVGKLLPVIEATPSVVGPLVPQLPQGLCHDHLPTDGLNEIVDLAR